MSPLHSVDKCAIFSCSVLFWAVKCITKKGYNFCLIFYYFFFVVGGWNLSNCTGGAGWLPKMELVEVCLQARVRKWDITMTSQRPLNYTPCLIANICQYTRNDHFHGCMSYYEACVNCWSLLILHCPKLFPVRWKTSVTRKCSSESPGVEQQTGLCATLDICESGERLDLGGGRDPSIS